MECAQLPMDGGFWRWIYSFDAHEIPAFFSRSTSFHSSRTLVESIPLHNANIDWMHSFTNLETRLVGKGGHLWRPRGTLFTSGGMLSGLSWVSGFPKQRKVKSLWQKSKAGNAPESKSSIRGLGKLALISNGGSFSFQLRERKPTTTRSRGVFHKDDVLGWQG